MIVRFVPITVMVVIVIAIFKDASAAKSTQHG
jgi:hypothetical protein